MAVSTGALQFILINLSLFAVYAIWGLFGRNGAGELLNAFKENGNLPASNIPIKTVYTGIPQLDGLFVTLNTFFWQVIDGSAPTLSLQSFQFAGQVWGLWALIMLEGVRAGNKGRVNS
ncbi:MAG: hypothetical protein LQ340_003016 [Diploschistes diacapsis]|nr:MAG: hypothetical protein LQ340_003016 [Diploschistes diacapsis]